MQHPFHHRHSHNRLSEKKGGGQKWKTRKAHHWQELVGNHPSEPRRIKLGRGSQRQVLFTPRIFDFTRAYLFSSYQFEFLSERKGPPEKKKGRKYNMILMASSTNIYWIGNSFLCLFCLFHTPEQKDSIFQKHSCLQSLSFFLTLSSSASLLIFVTC